MAFLFPLTLLTRAAFAAPEATAPAAVAEGGGFASHFPPETVGLFLAIFAFSLVMDLVQHKDHKEVSWQNAAGWSAFWIAISFAFMGWLKWHHGADHPEWASLFLTGYVLEKTLSVDNLMVFIAIFRYFRIASGLQHRILYYGILGAIVFRALFVGVGTGLLAIAGPWAEIGFGLFVGWCAYKMLRGGEKDLDYDNMPLVKFSKRFVAVFPRLAGVKFFVNRAEAEEIASKDPTLRLEAGVKRWMTPAFVCLLVVEGSDVMFSVDSVPAVIAVTKEPLIVYTAMIFAVLGLRSLYFIVEALTRFLSRLEQAIIFVLFIIAAKMLVSASEHLFHVNIPWWSQLSTGAQANYSMFLVLSVLAIGVIASLVAPKKEDDDEDKEEGDGEGGVQASGA